MARARRASAASASTGTLAGAGEQEMSNMYDYLAKIILLGPSGCGKSCLLHRFVKGEWRVLSSQTIGVEFASKIVKIGSGDYSGAARAPHGAARPGDAHAAGGRRKRIKLQLWDTAGTERFRSVSRSYYRGAAGAVLVYDVCDPASFAQLGPFLHDVRALASRHVAVVLAGNKSDLLEENRAGGDVREEEEEEELGRDDQDEIAHRRGKTALQQGEEAELSSSIASSMRSTTSTIGPGLGSRLRATTAGPGTGRGVPAATAASWASQHGIPASMEVSALNGDGVDAVFRKLASTILTKIELGEIDPDDPMSGIQYGDAEYYAGGGYDDGDSSIRSGGLTSDGYGSVRRRKRRGGWGDVFRIGRPGSSGGGAGKCC